jgi:putative DNA primase/helicase
MNNNHPTNKSFTSIISNGSWWKKDQNGRDVVNAPTLAMYIAQQSHLLFANGELHYYNNGVYQAGASKHVGNMVVRLLDDKFRSFHSNEVHRFLNDCYSSQPTSLDKSTQFINLENGLLDWDANALYEHSPQHLSSIRVPLTYDPNATCPHIERFLGQVLPIECHDLVLELFAYCLLPTTKLDIAVQLIGGGANGKSVFLKLLKSFIGAANTSAESLHDIEKNRFRLASLTGKLANICADIAGQHLPSSDTFKKLTTGDEISVEKKYCMPYTTCNFAKLFFSANQLPTCDDVSDGFFRRWIILRFPNQFLSGKADPDLLEKLTTPQELSGLLNLALPALRRLMSNKAFSIPLSVKRELNAYRKDNDSVVQFLDENCQLKPMQLYPKRKLFAAYMAWAKECNYKPCNIKQFSQQLQQLYPQVSEDRNTGIRQWKGIVYNGTAF